MSALAEAIEAQADVLEAMLRVDVDRAVAALEPVQRLWFVGTGTSQHAAELAAWMLAGAHREVRWASSSAFTWRRPQLGGRDGVVVISHTTETAFARRARDIALDSGAAVISITGPGRGWAEAIETAVREPSETYTVSYTAALVVLARLAQALEPAGVDGVQLSELPGRVRAAASEPVLFEAPPERLAVLAGTGPAAVTAREGALKLREAARVLAEGYEAEYLLHGSAVPLGAADTLIAVAPSLDGSGLVDGLARAARGEGLRVVSVEEPAGFDSVLAQIPITVRLQRLACELAERRGVDPDRVITSGWADDALWAAGAPET